MAKDKITPYKFLELAVGIYFGPYLLAYVVILVILAFARVALRKGMPNSDEVRKRVLQHSFVYVFCYSLQWTIYAGLWLAQIILLLQNDNRPLNQTRASLAITATAVFGLNGVLDFAVWMWSGQSVVHFINRRCLSSQSNDQLTSPLISDPGIVARQEVSAALRRDAMVCTSWAILDSVNVGMPAMEHAKRDSSSDLNYLTTDFKKVVKKWIFPPDGTHKFEFKDYAPETFAQLRAVQAIEADSYSTAFRNITKHDSDQELLEKFSDGKSGSFFYFSLDSRFIVKTVTLAELNFLRGILCHYYKYITDNPDSLLTRIYGLHRIRLAPHQKYLSMAVMGNILPRPGESCVIHEKYDLKGSSVGRRVLKRGEDRSSMDLSKKTLKDCDLVRKIVIGEDNKRRLLEQLRRDADFLASIGVMDYSLLLGIHFCDEDGHNKRQSVARAPQRDSSVALSIAESENSLDIGDTIRSTSISVNTSMDLEKYKPIHLRKPRRHGSSTGPPAAKQSHRDTSSYLIAPEEGYVPWFRRDLGGLRGADSCPERRCIYYMGIIDILQRYDWSKKTERFLKTKLLCKDGENISATNVLHYSQRFIEEIGGRFE
jgi:1-phosphatidylinositol-4-phosphate 5-kinase